MTDQLDLSLDESYLTPPTSTTGAPPVSPFLPGTNIQFAWDSTSLGLLKTCPRLYEYTLIHGWAPRDTSVHLTFGAEYHQALQEYDWSRSAGVPHEQAIHDTIRALMERTCDWVVDRDTKAGKYKNRDTLVSLVVDYLDHFIDDPATTYIKSDGTPAVELSFRFELGWGPSAADISSWDKSPGSQHMHIHTQPYLLCGHLDRVVDFNGQLLVLDHKTTTTTPSDYFFAQFEPSNQMTLYTLAGQVVLNTPVKGVMIRAAQLLLEAPNRFVSSMTYRTPDQLTEWEDDLRVWLTLAEAYADANHWPMNDTACDKFGGCKFRSICSKSPQVRDIYLKADFIKLEPEARWNPLNPR